ncbi:MAG: saccharopine dehydrogenase C-terminal domain-containing protein, partial [Eubacteriales bacterium]|nr:saccharopine dehydrogenase C-terminal domain-containing protein [Eubacteriales bacterium]
MGFFSTEEIDVNGVTVRPKDVSEKLFQKMWAKKWGLRDMTYLYVVGKGMKDGKFAEKAYELKTYSNEEAGITSMELATAYPISIAAMMVAKDDSGRAGIIDPELYFIGDKFHELVMHLGERDIPVYEK